MHAEHGCAAGLLSGALGRARETGLGVAIFCARGVRALRSRDDRMAGSSPRLNAPWSMRPNPGMRLALTALEKSRPLINLLAHPHHGIAFQHHAHSGPPPQPSMTSSSNATGPSPYTFDARRRSLNGASPPNPYGQAPPAHPQHACNLQDAQASSDPKLTRLQLHRTCFLHPRPPSSLPTRRTPNAHRLLPPSPRTETSLDLDKRCDPVAACPSPH